ncbi:heme-binding domain-containing protein [Chitinophaga varians]|uniref:heme-binding domain-containing protein n=1 Tax=Chitinophaga varians TaxID=2202339 RepID=UPI001CB713A1|nr:heme-binding domain-containing protein [Chitinophaga varians]
MKKFKWIAAILLLAFGSMQLFRPAKNQGDPQDLTADIGHVYTMPDSVHTLLQQACYDCHSNHTRYPWYADIQPAGWWLASHIREGKKELNFQEYGQYPPKRQRNKLKRIKEQLITGAMPLSSYTLIHREAIWTPAQRQAVIVFIDSTLEKL